MSEDAREPPSALKGRLADVYVPALVSGALEALSRRLGNRATLDDPLHGRASTLASLDPLIAKISSSFALGKASYEHLCSTTGVDRDAAEGVLALTIEGEAFRVPIAVVAERRRLREIELRVYYSAPKALKPQRAARPPLIGTTIEGAPPRLVATIIDALKTSNAEAALAGFEENGHAVDVRGERHAKADGTLRSYFDALGPVELVEGGSADDGRTCCMEVTIARKGSATSTVSPALLAFERGDTGLVRELRVYWE